MGSEEGPRVVVQAGRLVNGRGEEGRWSVDGLVGKRRRWISGGDRGEAVGSIGGG